MSDPLVLVLDQGGGSSRAMVFDASGEVVASAQQLVGTQHPHPGWVEQSPDQVLDSLRMPAVEVLRRLDPTQRSQLLAAGLVCQRSSLLGWDRKSGRALTAVLSWQDTRAADWLAAQQLDIAGIQRITGLYPNAHFGASKMRWCLDHLPQLIPALQTGQLALAPLASFLAYSLIEGHPFVVDPANASRTLLMDLNRRDWSSMLLARFGIQRSLLPDIVPSRHPYGRVLIDGTRLPFHLLNGDQSAAAFAGGVPVTDCAYINMGTGAFIYRALSQQAVTDHLLCSVLFSDGEHAVYAMEGTVNGAASALHWFEDQVQPTRVDFSPPMETFYRQQSSLPLFLNGIGGLGAPDWKADFASEFVGAGDPQQRALAVVESIAFLLMRNFSRLYADAALPHRVIVSGGLSRNDVLCQLLANLTGCTVERVTEQEASARGAAFLLLGELARWRITPGKEFTAADAGGKDQTSQLRYQRWTDLLEAALSH